MVKIRKVEICHFRGIECLLWYPRPGINCLVGPGDSGKSTVLDAIDLCLGARRNVSFTDIDFHQLNVDTPITISVTVGDLDEGLKDLDAYGLYVGGFHAKDRRLEGEPGRDLETVLTIRLTVESDLEPSWALVSERASELGQTRNLRWADRARLAPTRIGALAGYHLSWRRGSILNRVSSERVETSGALANAARRARVTFGDAVKGELEETLGIVKDTAQELGVSIGESIMATLDADSVSFSSGTISLHQDAGVPLRALGTGSTRLLIAGLHRKSAEESAIVLVDELEYGLEPQRIVRFLGSLDAKKSNSPLQVFMTTHSPVALRELSGNQLLITRPGSTKHQLLAAGVSDPIQKALRLYPDAFLAKTIIACEGASEVGFVRGIDLHRTGKGGIAIAAQGVALVDCGGGSSDNPFERAKAFLSLGYRVAVFRDNDKEPTKGVESEFSDNGGRVFTWEKGNALEDALFMSMSDEAVGKLLDRAVQIHGSELIDEHIKSASGNTLDLAGIRVEGLADGYSVATRQCLSKAAQFKRKGWFKSVTWMEDVANDIVAPNLAGAKSGFIAIVDAIFEWCGNARE